MSDDSLVEELIALDPGPPRRALLEQHREALTLEFVESLKAKVDHLMRSDLASATAVADLSLEIAEYTNDPEQRALGLLAKANVDLIGRGQFGPSVELYDQAAEIYRSLGKPVEQARSQTGKVAALANLGQYQEAIGVGESALRVLQEHGRNDLAVGLASNLGLTYSHQGDDARSLELFDQALALSGERPDESASTALLFQMNRSFALRNLGRFEEAIAAGELAVEGLERRGERAEAARAQQHLATTYYVMGHYNHALAMLLDARRRFAADLRQHDVAVVDLFTTECLIELRRFEEALRLCRDVRSQFIGSGATEQLAQVIVYEAVAYSQLGRPTEALRSLEEAQAILERVGNQLWIRATRLKAIRLLIRNGKAKLALESAAELARTFGQADLALDAARAHLLAGQAAMELDEIARCEAHVKSAQPIVIQVGLPELTYLTGLLRGYALSRRGEPKAALKELESSLSANEQLRGHMMVDDRVAFQEDKVNAYASAVLLALELDSPQEAFEYAERAKSRALIDLIAQRGQRRLRPYSARDRDLVDELTELRAERDQRYRRLEADLRIGLRGTGESGGEQPDQRQPLLELEQRIARRWRELLIRNADYAPDASLWQVRVEPIQRYLEPGHVVLEYFIARDQLIAFVVTSGQIKVSRLRFNGRRLVDLVSQFRLNLSTVPSIAQDEFPGLTANARGILRELHDLLLLPVWDDLSDRSRITIVPHGPLHYVPFHALWSGQSYLLEHKRISYLPAASILRYCLETRPSTTNALAIGYSAGGALPHALQEATTVASVLKGQTLLEGHATVDRTVALLGRQRLIHLATHGDFRSDNPLFSGLRLADGQLSVIDILGLDLNAALATLSACNTGQSVLGGGDELLGLMRALLAAGCASLVLSHWYVEDQTTAMLMERFYIALAGGATRAEALRAAQLLLLRGQAELPHLATAHPYYWAPFFLVGADGPI